MLSDDIKRIQRNIPELVGMVRNEMPYRIPKGYMRWDSISALIAITLDIAKEDRSSSSDGASMLHFYRSALWFLQKAPIYCLENDLLKAFRQCNVLDQQELLADLDPPIPTFMILYPQNSIKTPEGHSIDWAIVHIADVQHPEQSKAEGYGIKIPYLKHEYDQNLHWSTADNSGTVWFCGTGINRNGKINFNEAESIGANKISEKESEFLMEMRNIVFQCVLALAHEPELIDAVVQPVPTSIHRRRAKAETLSPRWIGKNYRKKQKTGCFSAPKGGSHASPRPHWRKAHQRLQPCGPGRQEIKLIKIKTRWIDPSD